MKNKLITLAIVIILFFGIYKDNYSGISITGEEEIPKPAVIVYK